MLRAATAAEHERVDRLFSRFDLARPEDYRAFLLAQARAFLPVEAALDQGAEDVIGDWPRRRRADLLKADLAALAAPLPHRLETAPELHGAPRIMGAVYVLEGSRLGGAFLKRSVPPEFPHAFLGAKAGPGSWRKLLEMLDKILYGPERIDAAISSAKEVFMLFEAAASDDQEARVA